MIAFAYYQQVQDPTSAANVSRAPAPAGDGYPDHYNRPYDADPYATPYAPYDPAAAAGAAPSYQPTYAPPPGPPPAASDHGYGVGMGAGMAPEQVTCWFKRRRPRAAGGASAHLRVKDFWQTRQTWAAARCDAWWRTRCSFRRNPLPQWHTWGL